MKQSIGAARAVQQLFSMFRIFKAGIAAMILVLLTQSAASQAVSGIITDYNGYWKTSAATPSAVKPDNSHNLLAFTYNGVQYSTGVNDELLSAKNQTYVRGDFWALPVENISATLTSNTKAGFGALYDGVLNGPSLFPPAYGIAPYLTDGIKGLNLGTCVANLPAGNMTFIITNIQASSIGDGVPDILVTQIADPSGASDRYEFTDASGARVGNYKDIVFTHISPVATWTADFYEARINPLNLLLGFTQTDRPIRLWAADLSEFGITAANYTQIRNFKINLSGQSDVAFVAYNNRSMNFLNPLPVQYGYFKGALNDKSVKLSWQTFSEQDADKFIVERSEDGRTFTAVGSVKAKNTSGTTDYTFTDASALPGKSFYRLKQYDNDGSFQISTTVIRINNVINGAELNVYPNPAKGSINVEHAVATGSELLSIYNTVGVLIRQQKVVTGVAVTKMDLNGLTPGAYHVSFQNGSSKISSRFVVN